MQKFCLILIVGVLGFWVRRQAQESPKGNNVLLENVEALASFEISVPINCQGSGEQSCPINGKKYAFIYEGYSIEPNEETY